MNSARSCAVCGAVYQSSQPSKSTCSTRCKSKGKRQRQGHFSAYTLAHAGAYETQCLWCRQTFVAHPKVRLRFCSHSCRARYRVGQGPSCSVRFCACLTCGVVFRQVLTEQTCSEVCRGYQPRPPRAVSCLACGVSVQARQGVKRYCIECAEGNAQYSRRLRRRGALGRVDRVAVYERDGWRCQLCRQRVLRGRSVPHPLAPTLDHIYPLALGGSHEMLNVQLAHFRCNSRKGSRVSAVQLRLL